MYRFVLPLSLLVGAACVPEAIIESATDSDDESGTQATAESESASGDGDGDATGDGDGEASGDGDGDATGDGDGDTSGDGDGDASGDGDGDPDLCSSMEFAAGGELATVGPSASLDFGPEDSFSVATWAYLFDGKGEQRYLVAKGDENNSEWAITRSDLGLCFKHEGIANIACAPISTQGWHHYAVVYDAQSVRLYEDGVEIGSGAGAVGEPADTPLHIGSFDANSGVLDGRVDDLAIWDGALSGPEVAELASEQSAAGQLGVPLAAHWRFDEGLGSAISDASGNGLAATVVAGTWTTTCPGPGICSSLELDDNGDVVQTSSGAGLEYGPSDDFTVGARAYLYGPPSHIVVKGTNNTNEWSLTYNQNEGLCLNRQGEANLVCAAAPWGRWHHYAARYAAGEVTLFVDGVEIGAGMGLVGDTSPSDFKLGAINNNNTLEGALDEVALWGAALSDGEIAQVAARSVEPDALAELRGWWRFDEGVGATVADSSGNAYDGEVLGSDWRAICAP